MKKIMARINIEGLVQGVCFRAETRREAMALDLTGTVRNKADGSVEVCAQGRDEDVRTLVQWCRSGPAGASVTDLKVSFTRATGEFKDFRITTEFGNY